METPQQTLDIAKDKASDLLESNAKTASELILKTAETEVVKKQFEKHEAEDQRRFEEQEKDHKVLFSKISEVVGNNIEHIKEEKESHKNFMDNLDEAKKDINTLKVDVKGVKTDVQWLRQTAEAELKKNTDDKNEMLPRKEFEPYRLSMNFIIATFYGSMIAGIIGLVWWVIQSKIIK